MQDHSREDLAENHEPVNVLLVDDEPANLLALEAILQDPRLNLVNAYSGQDALRRLLEDDFAVVLLDVQMHTMDGFQTAKYIRGREASRRTPIVFLTAHESDRVVIEEAYALGAVDYLVKPLVPVMLRAKVAGFVELYEKTEQVKRQAEQLRELERRQFDLALRDSEQRFARFMEHLPGLAWIKDLDGRYVYLNEAAEKAFRTPRAELYGKTDQAIFPAEAAAQFMENDRRALASETGVQVVETLEHEDGNVHHSIVSKFPIPGPNGKPAMVGGIAIDITDRKQAEEALREADRRKDEFLATLAHELRNPLAPLRNALEVIRVTEGDVEVMEQARSMMERQLVQMERLIDDLLDVSRVTRGKLELRKEPVELAAVLASALETSRPLIEQAGHELTTTIPPDPIVVNADLTRLAQVFLNLLNNAAKYTEPPGHIWLTVEREASEVRVRVRDSGIGIPADKLGLVFELFMQVDRSLERSRGGLGIGLTLVKRLVEMHGGRIEARSAGPGRGSEFIVWLPVIQRPATRQTSAADRPSGAEQVKCRILVVDDNHDSAESLAMLLRILGSEVRTAHDGLEAVETAEQFHPAVVLMDIGMPKLNGYDAARRMRARDWAKSAVLVAMTGWGQYEDKRLAAEAGFDHHMTKPVDPAALKRLLASLQVPV
ncbi:MAG: response regulator [Pirellulales bacterium]